MNLTALQARFADERGIAMPFVIGIMTAVLAIATAVAVSSVSAISGTNRDEDSKSALGAADAGVAAAIARQNTIAGSGSAACLTTGSGGLLVTQAAQSNGWCAPVTGSIDGRTYSYQTKVNTDGTMQIISTGTSDGVPRRISVTAESSTGAGVFSASAVIGLDYITMDSNSQIFSNTATNGNHTMNSNATLCGNATVGIGKSLVRNGNSRHGGSSCTQTSYPVKQAQTTLAPVQQGDVVTNNSNGRFFGQDIRSSNKVTWSSSSRTLNLGSNSSVTLGGSNYSFCKLQMSSNTTLYIASGATVRIFFDTPEACGLASGTAQLDLDSNSQIVTTAGNPTHVALLFMGSDTRATTIRLNSNTQANEVCNSDFVIYAPKSHLEMDSNSRYCGAVAAKSIHLDSNSSIVSSSATDNFQVPGAAPHYVAKTFIECSPTTTSTPSANC